MEKKSGANKKAAVRDVGRTRRGCSSCEEVEKCFSTARLQRTLNPVCIAEEQQYNQIKERAYSLRSVFSGNERVVP